MKTAEQWYEQWTRLEGEHGTENVIRRVQIDALREAREIVDAIARHDAAALASLPELDKLIRDLELK